MPPLTKAQIAAEAAKEKKVERETVASVKAAWKAEIALISERLNNEAKDHELCDEYKEVIDDLNNHLTFPLSLPSQEVTFTVKLELRCDAKVVGGVSGSSGAWYPSLKNSNEFLRAVEAAVVEKFPGLEVDDFDIDNVELD